MTSNNKNKSYDILPEPELLGSVMCDVNKLNKICSRFLSYFWIQIALRFPSIFQFLFQCLHLQFQPRQGHPRFQLLHLLLKKKLLKVHLQKVFFRFKIYVIFVFVFIELALHLLYFNILCLNSRKIWRQMPKRELVGI